LIEDRELMHLVAEACLDEKAQRMIILEVKDLTVLADYFIIASGRSSIHVRSIVEHVEEKLKEQGIIPLHRDGQQQGVWAVLDCNSVILHVFRPEERDYYDLEGLWGGARQVELESAARE
jgi:ribosome-associated protein